MKNSKTTLNTTMNHSKMETQASDLQNCYKHQTTNMNKNIEEVIPNDNDNYPSRKPKTRRYLVLTFISSTLSLVSFSIAFATSSWIITEENLPNRNRSFVLGSERPPEYLTKRTFSGLWTLCYTEPGGSEFFCVGINHFSRDEYQLDEKDAALSIPYVIKSSAPFFFAAGSLIVIALPLGCVGQMFHKKKMLIFVAGVIFISSGLVLFVGQIVYISVFKTEVGGKLVSPSVLSQPILRYRYGYSFILVVLSFLLIELAGTNAVFLFIEVYTNPTRTLNGETSRNSKDVFSNGSLKVKESHGKSKHNPGAQLNGIKAEMILSSKENGLRLRNHRQHQLQNFRKRNRNSCRTVRRRAAHRVWDVRHFSDSEQRNPSRFNHILNTSQRIQKIQTLSDPEQKNLPRVHSFCQSGPLPTTSEPIWRSASLSSCAFIEDHDPGYTTVNPSNGHCICTHPSWIPDHQQINHPFLYIDGAGCVTYKNDFT